MIPPLGAGPTSKLISEGRVLEINERLKKEGDFFDPNEKTFHLELQ